MSISYIYIYIVYIYNWNGYLYSNLKLIVGDIIFIFDHLSTVEIHSLAMIKKIEYVIYNSILLLLNILNIMQLKQSIIMKHIDQKSNLNTLPNTFCTRARRRVRLLFKLRTCSRFFVLTFLASSSNTGYASFSSSATLESK